MEAMILAAGAGTRLRPLTDRLPKALIEVRGRPLLGHVMDRLVAAGTTRIVINTHYYAEQIGTFLEHHAPPGAEVALSPEPDGPYDTGGGLLAAAPLFRGDGPFLLHNVDVLSQIPLRGLLETHVAARDRSVQRLLASVAVQARDASRQLLFDSLGLLGWENRGSDGAVLGSERVRDAAGPLTRWSFTGIHVIEPAMLDLCERTGVFSIITWYLDLAR
ncbi:MAG: NTP transferase domain-containing protein, partial [Gemmatimonadales bacterium]|nr:NTP transferase domain-containing protein [Gemmatimonadales bacterium]